VSQKINQAFYHQDLDHFKQQINRKRKNFWLDNYSLHYYNAPFNTALSVKQYLGKKQIRFGISTLFA
jgi:hypothetical protein